MRPIAVCLGLISFAIVFVIWSFFVNSQKGQYIDEIAFDGSLYLKDKLWWLAGPILDVVSFLYIGVAVVVIVGIALIRKKWRLAFQVTGVILGANLTTQVLKKTVLDRPDFDVVWAPGNSLPSGHTTVAASLSLALLLVVPRRWRPWAGLAGVVYTTATGVSTLVGQWHRMSDVLAAIFVAGAWALAACAFSTRGDEDADDRPISGDTIRNGLVFVLGAVLTTALSLYYFGDAFRYWDTTAMSDFWIQRDAFLAASFAVLAASFTIFGFTLILRQAVARMR